MATATRPAPKFTFLSRERRAQLIQLREQLAPILDNNLLRHFTDHSVSHSDHVCEIIDKLISPAGATAEQLNENELVVLYASAYLHDVGMHYEKAGTTSIIRQLKLVPPWDDLTDDTKLQLIRTYHPLIAAELVQLSATSAQAPLGIHLTSQFFPNEVACLCAAHTLDTSSDRYNELTQPAPNIRMKLLAALLRLADILDESRRRACRNKAETLELDIESQSHWWRHYYTRDIEFNVTTKHLVIWFEFPAALQPTYREVIPQLQMPHVTRELSSHLPALNQAGLVWTASQRISELEYDIVETMPWEVLTHMLKSVTRMREQAKEDARQIALQSFKSSRPYINQRLTDLRKKRADMAPEHYLDELAHIAFDLWDVGSRRSAWMALYSVYPELRAHVDQAKRIDIGTRLLEMLIQDRVPDFANSWIDSFYQECEQLPANSVSRIKGKHIVAEWYYQMGKTDNAFTLLMDLVNDENNEQRRTLLRARIEEMQLLLGSPLMMNQE